MDFARRFNGPHSLLIIYYAGHGSYNNHVEKLELHAYNNAERPLLEDSECDILAILDCCFASNIQKHGQEMQPRNYEVLTASGYNRVTAGPGKNSFTTALIASLEDLLKENGGNHFDTRQLCEKINLRPERLHNPSHVWSRLKTYDRPITLAPRNLSTDSVTGAFNPNNTQAFLALRVLLTVKPENLTKDQVSKIAAALSEAVKDTRAPINQIV
ncbi:hypothetical protein AOQ84DRAFT_411318 [Glonium stellatum]|uniref:Caspase domain-containing protein n=1 Tax=Glonium stellatum TaxID=574774 RepID=A0A8E2EWR9_9PEZI|nr:hypothetical protein AOQ84DRAFT_411318 [Glonium stellatum]